MALHEVRPGIGVSDARPAAGTAAAPAMGAAPGEGRSIGELLRDLADDSTRLVRDEIALARAEATAKVKQAGAAAAMIAAGAVLAIPAFIILLYGIVRLLALWMPDWVAGLIVGLVVAAVAGLLAWKGVSDLSAGSLTPERTAANLKRDVGLVQEKVS